MSASVPPRHWAGAQVNLPPGVHGIILFDGVCNLCAGSVRFIARRDPRGRFAFAALQSEVAAQLLRAAGATAAATTAAGATPAGAASAGATPVSGTQEALITTAPGSILLIDAEGVHARSDAVLRIARELRAPWPVLWTLRWLPLGLRDGIYRWVARRRYRWFGRTEACMVPTKALRARFLG